MHPKLARLETLMTTAAEAAREADRCTMDDDRLGALIDARDAAEQAVTDAVTEILGESPEWSNLYGCAAAFEECSDKLALAA